MGRKLKTEYLKVKGGQAVPFETQDHDEMLVREGRTPPTGMDVVEIPGVSFWRDARKPRRLAFWSETSPTAWPLGERVVVPPKAFRVADLVNLLGPYLSGIVARALKLSKEKFSLKDWVLIGLTGTSLLISIVVLIIVVVAFRRADLL